MKKHLQRHTVFAIELNGQLREIQPVDGAAMYDQPHGFDRGIVHFADPKTAECLGQSSVDWFEQNASAVENPQHRMQKYLCKDLHFCIPIKQKDRRRKGIKTIVRPVDAEGRYNDVGFSHGFVHFAHPVTGVCLGFCGTHYFGKHAVEVSP